MKDIIDSLIKQNEPRVKCRNPVRPVYRDAVRNPVNFFTHFRSRKKKNSWTIDIQNVARRSHEKNKGQIQFKTVSREKPTIW